jgi:predicted MFS family arabinose efflux permease
MGLGHNVLYTYIAPWSLTAGGVSESELGAVLLCYGAAGIIGLVVAGTLGDRHPRLVVNVMMAGMVIALVAMALVGHGVPPVVAGMILWSAGFAGLPALLQTRTLHGASARLRDLSGAINGTAFNVAIGGGALVGGLVLDTFGITALPWVAAVFVGLGLVWTIATDGARIRAHPAEAHLG